MFEEDYMMWLFMDCKVIEDGVTYQIIRCNNDRDRNEISMFHIAFICCTLFLFLLFVCKTPSDTKNEEKETQVNDQVYMQMEEEMPQEENYTHI